MDKLKNNILIQRIFKEVLNVNDDVIVLDLNEDSIDYGIYLNDNRTCSNDDLKNYISDYAIATSEVNDNKYLYLIAVHDYGDYNLPPSSEYIESKELYDTFEDCLFALINHIVKDNFYQLLDDHTIISEQE